MMQKYWRQLPPAGRCGEMYLCAEHFLFSVVPLVPGDCPPAGRCSVRLDCKDLGRLNLCCELVTGFTPKSNRVKYCQACTKKMRRRQEAERQRKRYHQPKTMK